LTGGVKAERRDTRAGCTVIPSLDFNQMAAVQMREKSDIGDDMLR